MTQTGQILKILRENAGYSQDTLAEFLNIKRELISYYETGSRETPLPVKEKLADLFGVGLEVFFSDNVESVVADVAFAFRADSLSQHDLESIAEFRRIVKNYQRILNLERKNA
jgi:transcriptional regulator with XRE-family HTH domain